jgi:hypothetical protein
MASLIVIRIVPQKPTDPLSFSTALAAGGGLQITVTTLAFASVDNQPPGANSVTASYIPLTPSGGWSVSDGSVFPANAVISLVMPPYPAGLTGGIIQQVDYVVASGIAAVELQAVATAVLQVPWAAPQLENISVTATRGGETLAFEVDYYVLAPNSVAVPDLSTWAPGGGSAQQDLWGQLPANLYLALPPAPPSNPAAALQLPTDGTPPPFDALLIAVNAILALDPGPTVVTATVAAPGAAAGATQLPFGAAPAGVVVGMTASGAGILAGATVVAIAGGTVTLSEEVLPVGVGVGATVKFTPTLGALTYNQCRNIAYELLWSQQGPLPTPPDPIENLYSNPPNDGALTKSGSTNPNPNESDRQQFEAQLKTYYSGTNANADRLTNYVFALTAAVSCEQMSLAANEALIRFPAQPDAAGTASASDQSVILTALDTIAAPAHFGVPAAYFYALAGATPPSRDANRRYGDATGAPLAQALSELSAAINAQTVSDAEGFVASGVAGQINAAQAARRLGALDVPNGSTTALAPLDTVALATTLTAASGTTLTFASAAELKTGLAVSGPGIAPGATITGLTSTNVTLSTPLLAAAPSGATIVFTPAYSAAWQALIVAWLAFPAAVPGSISSQAYQTGDDDTLFWPGEAAAQQEAFLELVLCALTGGYIIPPPFAVALGDKILDFLKTINPTPAVATLAQVSQAQWASLFTPNPTWLPPQPGGIGAQLNAFIEALRGLAPVSAGGPISVINLATSAATASGNVLTFASTSGFPSPLPPPPAWSVSSLLTAVVSGKVVPVIPNGTQISAMTASTVTLTNAVVGPVPAGTNITFRPQLAAAASASLPTFAAPSTDWLANCLAAYQPGFTFGQGIANPANLPTAAASVFPGDPAAQAWLVEAFTAIDALCSLVAAATGQPVTGGAGPAPLPGALGFSIVEALYACGFRSAADITALSQSDFTQALTGSPAFVVATALYTAAVKIAPPVPAVPAGLPGFHPINPDGSLTNCIPPPSLSPLGPVAYLQELLSVAENATCEQPTPTTPGLTLGQAVAARRGPLANLAASAANLETKLPLIDLVNECLEFMGAAATPASGTVYDTAGDKLAGFALCPKDECPPEAAAADSCFDAARLFAALPEHATPAEPTTANAAVQPTVYDKLKADFSSPALPYAQALDVSRSILRHFGSCRFEAMRTFRRCITEFVFQPARDPPGFDDQVWRYPVRIDTAIEYLGVTPEEYTSLFQGTPVPFCFQQHDNGDRTSAQPTPAEALLVLGASLSTDAGTNTDGILRLDQFLRRLGLDYCEFHTLWSSGIVSFGNRGTAGREGNGEGELGKFPPCEPCCLDKLAIGFPRETNPELGLLQLVLVVRLWRKLREHGCCGYSFDQLRDICEVLQLFTATGVNPEFIRQLAAFQMLRDDFHLPLAEGTPSAGATGVARSPLLALWATPQPPQFAWAVRQLMQGVASHARRCFGAERRDAEFLDRLASELDPLSRLAGFDPASATDNWHAAPNHTLRFAEILSKLCASPFRLAEARYLFTADPLQYAHSPFPLQETHEALTHPLDLPEHRHDGDQREDERRHDNHRRDEHRDEHADRHDISLLHLRRRLLEAHVDREELHQWHWPRIAAHLHRDLGFAEAEILALGAHFFPRVLESAGLHLAPADLRFQSALASGATSPTTWTTPPNNPFQYDTGAQMLWTTVPLEDSAVLAKLADTHVFSGPEQTAIQDLYFQPRASLARFGLLFPDFPAAVSALVEAQGEEARWDFFRHAVALCLSRRRIVAEHLARHVAAATGAHGRHGEDVALLIFGNLLADENALAPTVSDPTPTWENPDGTHLPSYWPSPTGGALAALLALTGTGLVAEYAVAGGGTVWRDACGALDGFGHRRNRQNCPVPTVLPALNATLPPSQSAFVSARNGLLFANLSNAPLGGAQGFTVTWSGALLIEHEGHYEFWSGAPRHRDEDDDERDTPDFDAESGAAWHITLQRGARTWVIASRAWPSEPDRRFAAVPLRPGAYEITIALTQPGPDFTSAAEVRPRHTGLALVYAGPDTDGARIQIPHRRLMQVLKDKPLGDGIAGLATGPTNYLATLYVASLRDIRRTYQRAFKALLFVHRFALAAAERPDEPSELGYMLNHAARFAGTGFARVGPAYVAQLANFDFNYLPVLDDYHAPAGDQRAQPSPPRTWALFDSWERLFDYTVLRTDARGRDRHPWRLFAEAADKLPADPGYLLREIGAPPTHWPLDLGFFQARGLPPYQVTAVDLEDERWTIRAWRADRWLDAMRRNFAATNLAAIRPDLWVSDNPAAIAGQTTGNGNLLEFLCRGEFLPDAPCRMQAVRALTDGLRRRARDALAAYLCAANRTPLPFGAGLFATAPIDLSPLLLMDVETGPAERASRIEEAISAIQTFVRRARLWLEPGWAVTPAFERFWDRQFASFDTWRACKARHLYKENWLEWTELDKARRSEAFRFLESRLEAGALSIAAPGGNEWWPQAPPPDHDGLELTERRESVELGLLATPREGLGILATPERAARPSWLAALPPPPAAAGQGAGTTSGAIATAASTPIWLQAAIRLGVSFVRLAAAGAPQAAHRFAPRPAEHGCVDCCAECGCKHQPAVDGYYFWLIGSRYFDNAPLPAGVQPSESNDGYEFGFQDDYYDAGQQQSAFWQDPTQLPQLLTWQSQPMVRLAWCRVHNCQFSQPRRSTFGVAVQPGGTVDLVFAGRSGDSLFFTVATGIAPQGYADSSPPGFRYDQPRDAAVPLPMVAAPGAAPLFVGGLPAYPWFAYDVPGEPPVPLSAFSPALAVARWLRAHCRFEGALRWSRYAFDPLQSDCAWIRCGPTQQSQQPGQPQNPGGTPAAPSIAGVREPPPNPHAACCDAADVPCDKAEQRAVLLFYLETLVEWGQALTRRRRTPEAAQQARVIFDAARVILGTIPLSVRMPEPSTPATVGAFAPQAASLNPRLLDIYERVADQLALIHHGLEARRLPDAALRGHGGYFGESPLREGWRTEAGPCCDDAPWCHPPSPYRFTFLIQKALDYAVKTQELGGALLSAFEKGDAEYLAALRAGHERELLALGRDGRKDQWREADWQIESLQKTKAVSQANLTYYTGLINANLIDGELQYENQINAALSLHGTANTVEAIGEGLRLIPDFVVGGAGFGGSPVAISWLPLGTKLGDMFAASARIINNVAQIDSETGSLDLTESGWIRRYAEWVHQQQVLIIEIQQIERQILGAERRRDQMLHELNTHERQIEQAEEIDGFLRDKFTNHALYLFMQHELAALYSRTFDLALDAARQAECAFNLERGHVTRHFVADCLWDELREGLTAGERLPAAVRRMEKAYFDENIREYELTKHFSLRQSFPLAYLQLRTTGRCEIEIPEWMFDQDFPGQYLRRIRSVSLTLPCVAGPYTGVHCRLTLIDSLTRIDPRLDAPPHSCCCPPPPCDCGERCQPGAYRLCPDDPRMVRIYGEREAIATSGGQNDSGLFELSFNDPRYLPFEYMGAVSRWRIELPAETNYFDPDTLTDLVMHLNYTAREGGAGLREAALLAARCKLPGDGWAFFDIRHDFPEAWELLTRERHGEDHDDADHRLALRISRRFFPFLPHNPPIHVTRLILGLQVAADRDDCPEYRGCPCPGWERPAWRRVRLLRPCGEERRGEGKESFICHADPEKSELFIGTVGVEIPPFRRGVEHVELAFGLPADLGELVQAYLFCAYEPIEQCCHDFTRAPRQKEAVH